MECQPTVLNVAKFGMGMACFTSIFLFGLVDQSHFQGECVPGYAQFPHIESYCWKKLYTCIDCEQHPYAPRMEYLFTFIINL